VQRQSGNGKVAQAGPVREVFSRPASVAVAGLLTVETIQPGRIVKTGNDLATVAIGSTLLTAMAPNPPAKTGDVYVCIRAEDVILLRSGESSGSARNQLAAIVQSVTGEGPLRRVELDCGFTLAVLLTRQASEEMALKPGDRVVALVKAPHVHLIPR